MAGAVSPQKPEIRCRADLEHGSKKGRKCGSLLLTSDGQALCLNNEHHPRHILDVLEDAVTQGIITKGQILAVVNTPNKEEKQMPIDLSKVKEVMSTIGKDIVNEKLKSGKWILLEVKTVEYTNWHQKSMYNERAYLDKDSHTIYVLGRIK